MVLKPIIIWLRNDLRLNDHPAFFAAENAPVIPVYIFSQEEEGDFPQGEASKVWLHHSLEALKLDLKARGSSLVLRKGDSIQNLKELIHETGAETVFWTRRYEPSSLIRDAKVKDELTKLGIVVKSFAGQLLFEPWTVKTKLGKPFQIFTPFWNACKNLSLRKPFDITSITAWNGNVKSLSLKELDLLPKIHWDKKLLKYWTPGEKGAKFLLDVFIKKNLAHYEIMRNFPALNEGVSKLSPHLHFGEISPFQVWHAISSFPQSEGFLRQIIWREFAFHLLYHFPYIVKKAFKASFENFAWEDNSELLMKWQKGLTGYPIIDAGMRQLWETGWMHNRVRMIVGSFLVKDLLISWKWGASWFWNTLVDADLANNTLGWQWIGGMGADAAPYFRIFNPVLQGEKFDPEGDYVKKYLPQLRALSKKWIHRPFEAPDSVLMSAGVILGKTYPFPIVDHASARKRALSIYKVN